MEKRSLIIRIMYYRVKRCIKGVEMSFYFLNIPILLIKEWLKSRFPCFCELNGDTESRLNCAIILYVEGLPVPAGTRKLFLSSIFLRTRIALAVIAPGNPQTLPSIVLDAISLLESEMFPVFM